jgi:hypothetical protein
VTPRDLRAIGRELIREAEDARKAEDLDAVLGALPPTLRPFGGSLALLIANLGPKDLRRAAGRVFAERTFRAVSAHVRRSQMRVVKA